jgi:hypothetical protein
LYNDYLVLGKSDDGNNHFNGITGFLLVRPRV